MAQVYHNIWYVYQNSQQLGPFTDQQVGQLFSNKMINEDAYLYKVGWEDWRALDVCADEIAHECEVIPMTRPSPKRGSREERETPRIGCEGRIIVHNQGQLVIANGVNISATGVFIETPERLFKVGEDLRLTCRIDGSLPAFNAVAEVIRYSHEEGFAAGYGLRFTSIEKYVAEEIQRIVDEHNQAIESNKQVSSL